MSGAVRLHVNIATLAFSLPPLPARLPLPLGFRPAAYRFSQTPKRKQAINHPGIIADCFAVSPSARREISLNDQESEAFLKSRGKRLHVFAHEVSIKHFIGNIHLLDVVILYGCITLYKVLILFEHKNISRVSIFILLPRSSFFP